MISLLAFFLFGIFTLDRLLKHIAVFIFFRRQNPALPATWPSISLIQPITHSPNDLQAVLRSRARLVYPGTLQQILVYDEQDRQSLAVIEQVGREFSDWRPELLRVQQADYAIATKSFKMDAAVMLTAREVICFVDDDIVLPPNALQILIAYLAQSGVGAVFGLACYTNWQTLWSGLISAFVNSNALFTYIPFTFFLEPFTITGHCYAMRREVFESAGGLTDMQERLDDDHELARRIRQLGLRLCQTPMVYCVDNALSSWRSYQGQMKRWFVFPRQMMLPDMSRTEQMASLLCTFTLLIPSVLAVLAVLSAHPGVWLVLVACLSVFSLVYALEERLFLPQHTPLSRWSLVLASAVLAPFQVLWALFSNTVIEWRGQRLRIKRGGRFERL